MKILLVTYNVVPGGGAIYSYNLAAGLEERGNRVMVYCASNKLTLHHPPLKLARNVDLKTFGYKLNNDIIRLNRPDPVINSYTPKLLKDFRKTIDDFKPDIVHFISFECQSIFLIHECRIRSVPTVFSLLDNYSFCLRFNTLLKAHDGPGILCNISSKEGCTECFLEWHGIKLCKDVSASKELCSAISKYISLRKKILGDSLRLLDAVIAPSEYILKRHLQEYPFLKNKFRLIPHGIKANDAIGTSLACRQSCSSDETVFGYIGGKSLVKGYYDIMKAFQQLPSGYRLRMWGMGIPNDTMSPRSNIEFKGYYKPDEINGIFKEMDVLVHPSYWENAPLSIRESFARGIPVISFDNPGSSEIVKNGLNGIVVRSGNLAELKRAIVKLSKKIVRTGMRKYILNNPPKTFNSELNEISALYEMLMNKRKHKKSIRLESEYRGKYNLALSYSKVFSEVPYFQGVTNNKFAVSDVRSFISVVPSNDAFQHLFWLHYLIRKHLDTRLLDGLTRKMLTSRYFKDISTRKTIISFIKSNIADTAELRHLIDFMLDI